MPKMTPPLSLCIADHTQLVPETKILSSTNQNLARKKTLNFVSHSKSSITSPESSANQNRVLHHARALGFGGRPPRLSAPLGSL